MERKTDLQDVLKQKLLIAKEYNDEVMGICEAHIEKINEALNYINSRDDIPETTDTIEKIQASFGRDVELEESEWPSITINYYDYRNGYLQTEEDGRFLLVDEGVNGVKRIVDKETSKVIFENPWFNEHLVIQYAMLFGKNAGREKAESMLKREEEHIKDFKRIYAESKEKTEKTPEWINRGKNFIYPQKEDEWTNFVLGTITNNQTPHGVETLLTIMEALDKGESCEKVREILYLSKIDTDPPLKNDIVTAIAKFSKRGPEFYRAEAFKNPEWLQEIEEQNKKFESALADDELHSNNKSR